MKKVTAMMILFGIIVIAFTGCSTTRYGVEISNVPNVREIRIRNAGTTQWGVNLAGNRDNIDVSGFSEMVDIMVVDANGIVHSRHNVPFTDAAFVVARETYIGMGTNVLAGFIALGGLIALLAFMPDADTAMNAIGVTQW